MKFKRTVLKNGMRVITVHLAETPTVTVLTMVETGSKYETKDINGLSHFLEHMNFKGTEKRPTALAISRELESIGSAYNAFTSEEYTGYYAKAAAKHGDKILDIVADIYLNSVFPEAEIEKEKGVIVEEINMYRDLPHRHVQALFSELLYGDQPAGWDIAGTREIVQALKREDFVKYRDRHYVAEATTVIVAGNFDEKKMIAQIKETYGAIKTTKKAKKVKVKELQSEPQFKIERRTTDQSHLVIGVRGYPIGNKLSPTVRVMNAVLGAGMSSRLFQKLREEMGVGYYVRSSYDTYTDHGIFSVSIGCDIKRVEEVVKAIIEQFTILRTELIPEEELQKTKDYILGSMLLGLESSDSIAEFYGFQEIANQPLKTVADITKEINAVTAKGIKAIAQKLFVDKHLNLSAVGPMPEDQKLKELLHF